MGSFRYDLLYLIVDHWEKLSFGFFVYLLIVVLYLWFFLTIYISRFCLIFLQKYHSYGPKNYF